MNETRYREAEQRLWESVGVTPSERRLRLPRFDSEVRVQEVGDGPPVVFVHGGSASGANWAPLIGSSSGLRCILLDRPGCGLSPPLDVDQSDMGGLLEVADELVADVVDALDLPSAHVVATSLGGLIAIRGAAAHPERIDRMVEFGFVPGSGLVRLPISMRLATIPGLRHLMTRLPPTRGAVRAIMRQLGHGPALKDGRITPEMLDWFLRLLRDTPTMRNDSDLPRELLQPDASETLLPADLLGAVRTPIRFIWGESDPIGGPDVARRFVAHLPHADLELWPGSGHAPWLDDAELAATRVGEFLLGVDAPQR